MEHVLDALDGRPGYWLLGEVALEELDAGQVIEIAPLAGDQAIGHADAMSAAKQLLGKVGTNEAGPPGDEIESHSVAALLRVESSAKYTPVEEKMSQPAVS